MSKTILELAEIGLHTLWDISMLAVIIRWVWVEKSRVWGFTLFTGYVVIGVPLAIVSILLILERIG